MLRRTRLVIAGGRLAKIMETALPYLFYFVFCCMQKMTVARAVSIGAIPPSSFDGLAFNRIIHGRALFDSIFALSS